MKKYRLRQWYPSLPESIEVGIIVTINSKSFCSNGDNVEYYLLQDNPKMWVCSKELHPDFWELIEEEKPLFTTADSVDIFKGDKFIIVTDNFIKNEFVAYNVLYGDGIYRAFKHESRADEYILWNKPLFSLREIDATVEGCLPEFVELIKLARERVEQ